MLTLRWFSLSPTLAHVLGSDMGWIVRQGAFASYQSRAITDCCLVCILGMDMSRGIAFKTPLVPGYATGFSATAAPAAATPWPMRSARRCSEAW